jgi:hypothetical protein
MDPVTLNQLLNFRITGRSGGRYAMDPEIANSLLMNAPDMLNARLGLQGKNMSAGIMANFIRLPDGTLVRKFGPVDMQYQVPFMGGTAGIKGTVMPQRDYSAQMFYQREF